MRERKKNEPRIAVDLTASLPQEPQMRAPRFAAITLALDTERFRFERLEVREHHIAYLLNRLMAGEEVAESEFVHHGIKVTIREATSPEILPPR